MTLQQAFNNAINNPGNRYEIDADGFHVMSDSQTHNINWNFVDADCAIDTNESSSYRSPDEDGFTMVDCEAYYDQFDALCTQYEAGLSND